MPRQDAAPPLSGTRWAAPMQLGVVAWGGGSGVWWCPRVAHAFFGGGMGVVGFFLREESAMFCFYCLSLSRCACAMLGAATPTRPGAALPIPLLVVWSPRCRPPLTPTAAVAEAAWLSRAALSTFHSRPSAPWPPSRHAPSAHGRRQQWRWAAAAAAAAATVAAAATAAGAAGGGAAGGGAAATEDVAVGARTTVGYLPEGGTREGRLPTVRPPGPRPCSSGCPVPRRRYARGRGGSRRASPCAFRPLSSVKRGVGRAPGAVNAPLPVHHPRSPTETVAATPLEPPIHPP